MRRSAVVLAALLMSGCAALSGQGVATPGQAIYHYERRADGTCTLDITSARDLASPSLSLDKDCAIVAKAADTMGLAVGAAQQAVFMQALLVALKAAGLLVAP